MKFVGFCDLSGPGKIIAPLKDEKFYYCILARCLCT